MKFINWERKGNFKISRIFFHLVFKSVFDNYLKCSSVVFAKMGKKTGRGAIKTMTNTPYIHILI